MTEPKQEPTDEYEDALSTLASAAVEHHSQALPNGHSPYELVANSLQPQQVAASTVQPLQTIKQEPKPTSASVAQPPIVPTISFSSRQWYDVGIMRRPSCVVTHFFYTETAVEHGADTSDALPDYTDLRRLPLLPGIAYKFRVAAINSCGIGDFSEVSAFKTCLPGFPGAPCAIRISKLSHGITLNWGPPLLRYGRIVEYSVCMRVKPEVLGDNSALYGTPAGLSFVRVYCGVENQAFVENGSLEAALIDRSTSSPAIVFRIAARNEKGYGPATQVRWVHDFDANGFDGNRGQKRPYSQI